MKVVIITDNDQIFDWASMAFEHHDPTRYKKRSTFDAAKVYADPGDMVVGNFSQHHKVKLQEKGYTVVLPPPDMA